MIERTTLTPPLSRTDGLADSEALPARMASWILPFLILMIALSIVTCVFIWQANAINDTNANTTRLRAAASRLEQENASLMVELAKLDSPANVEREAARKGLTVRNAPAVAVAPATAVIPLGGTPQSQSIQIPDQITAWVGDLARKAGLASGSGTP